MNILLIGGAGSFMNNLITKFNKEGHRIHLLTGARFVGNAYPRVFERYDITYDSPCLDEIFDSANPDVTIFTGTFDSNFKWNNESQDASRYITSLMNILMAYSVKGKGRFIYLSDDEIFSRDYDDPISEAEPPTPEGSKAVTFSQCEDMCHSFLESRELDVVILRIGQLYKLPLTRADVTDICTKMCLEAVESGTITIDRDDTVSLIFESDVIEYLYRLCTAKNHNYYLYNLSSMKEYKYSELAGMVADAAGKQVSIRVNDPRPGIKKVLSNKLFDSEFGLRFFAKDKSIIAMIIKAMNRDKGAFFQGMERKLSLRERLKKGGGWLLTGIVPFIENIIVFFIIRALNSNINIAEYSGVVDLYLLYVIVFAMMYGQQQAAFSGLLATIGYCYGQLMHRSSMDILLDTATYIWLVQLFIVGLGVGNLRDKIRRQKEETQDEMLFMEQQLYDIQDINNSNVRVKDALETQILNQSDSVGKIYGITSALDKYSSDEVLFYASEIVSQLMHSKDVAIYVISNADYARLFSATSDKARSLGHSIKYPEMTDVYKALTERKVYINRSMDKAYPMMASGIYNEDNLQLMIMIWGLPWESMTLGQANQLTIIGSLIQNAVLRANRYLDALENERYVDGSKMMETNAFISLAKAHLTAQRKGLTECVILRIDKDADNYFEDAKVLSSKLRNSDYVGTFADGRLYVLLSNTNEETVGFVVKRFEGLGYKSHIATEVIE